MQEGRAGAKWRVLAGYGASGAIMAGDGAPHP